MIKFLVAHHLKPKAHDEWSGWLSSKFAVMTASRRKTREALLGRLTSIRHRRRLSPFHCAVANNHQEVVRYFLEELRVPVDSVSGRSAQALHLACAGMLNPSVPPGLHLLLLRSGAAVDARDSAGMTALHLCCQ